MVVRLVVTSDMPRFADIGPWLPGLVEPDSLSFKGFSSGGDPF
jgi:hypothetical protein